MVRREFLICKCTSIDVKIQLPVRMLNVSFVCIHELLQAAITEGLVSK